MRVILLSISQFLSFKSGAFLVLVYSRPGSRRRKGYFGKFLPSFFGLLKNPGLFAAPS
jgi:hypothetical protein